MKPVVIVPKDAMSMADLKRLRENDVCVVESDAPITILDTDRTLFQRASTELCGMLMDKNADTNFTVQGLRSWLCRIMADLSKKDAENVQ